MRTTRLILGVIAFVAVVFAAEYPLRWAYLYGVRTCCIAAEAVGIMDRAGPLGGQVMGFNFQREPAWVHGAAAVVSAAVVFAPAVLLGVVVMRRVGGGWRATRCGACNRVLRGLSTPACPWCGASFGGDRAAASGAGGGR
ncbi:MAG: hypothetical protein KF745_07555 [Phycisphaeraceae bacterium]|nr:hypothetical protein [Phycisphaeraceae bacterium]